MGYEMAAFGFVAAINRVTKKQENIVLSRVGTADHILVHLAVSLKILMVVTKHMFLKRFSSISLRSLVCNVL